MQLSLLLALATVAPANSTPTEPSNALRVIPASVNLGERDADIQVSSQVWVVNDSNKPLELSGVKGSCGCMKVHDFEPHTLAPHAAMPVSFDIHSPKEDQKKAVALTVLAAGDQAVKVPVEFSVVAGTESTPSAPLGKVVALAGRTHMELAVGDSADGSAWLINNGDTTLHVDGVKGSCGCTKISGEQSFDLAPGEAHEVAFRISAAKAATPAKRKLVRFVAGDQIYEAAFQLTTLAADGAAIAAAAPAM